MPSPLRQISYRSVERTVLWPITINDYENATSHMGKSLNKYLNNVLTFQKWDKDDFFHYKVKLRDKTESFIIDLNLLKKSNYKEIDEFNSKNINKDFNKNLYEFLSPDGNLAAFVFKKDWHKGVIGIVASRLIEKYYRPTLVFTKSNDVLAASARSVKGYDVYDALLKCKDNIFQFGGHKYAAGLTLKPENYFAFKKSFEEYVKKTIDKKLLTPIINVNEKIELTDITPKFYRILKQFAPFGPANKQPVFYSENLLDTGYCKTVGEDDKHLKLSLSTREFRRI